MIMTSQRFSAGMKFSAPLPAPRIFLDLQGNNYLIIVFPGRSGADVYLGFSSSYRAVDGCFFGDKIPDIIFSHD